MMNDARTPLKLNLGCGFRKYPGYVNVDSAPECQPDVVWDLEKIPWPWKDDSVDEIKMEHILEHLGPTTESYLAIWKEIWRVCKNGAVIELSFPHFKHEVQYHDPTHVRVITPIGIAMFDQVRNIRDIESGGRETKLGLMAGIDIALDGRDIKHGYNPHFANMLKRGEISETELAERAEREDNVILETTMRAYVVKPARGEEWLKYWNSIQQAERLEALGEHDAAYEILKTLPPNMRGIPAKIGWHRIRLGDFSGGYPLLHEERDVWRPEFNYSLPPEKQLRRGEFLSGKTIFVLPEGGLGDELMHARFVEEYKKKGARVILGASPSLHAILARLPSPPDEIRSPETVDASEYDFWTPTMSSLMLLSREDPASGLTFPYLSAHPAYKEKWRAETELPAQGRMKIGVRWQGKQAAGATTLRVESVPAKALLPLSAIGSLFSLQRDSGLNELEVGDPVYDLGTRLDTWEDTLGAMSNMDYIVTSCTSVAHAAGALGIPTALIVYIRPYYPWIHGDTTPWYQSVRVFRQEMPGDWSSPIRRAGEWLLSKEI